MSPAPTATLIADKLPVTAAKVKVQPATVSDAVDVDRLPDSAVGMYTTGPILSTTLLVAILQFSTGPVNKVVTCSCAAALAKLLVTTVGTADR